MDAIFVVQVQTGCLSINSEAVTIFGQFLPKQICSLPRGIRRTTSHLNSSRSLPLSGRSLAPRFESLITRSLHLSKYKRPSHVNHGHQQSDLILSHGGLLSASAARLRKFLHGRRCYNLLLITFPLLPLVPSAAHCIDLCILLYIDDGKSRQACDAGSVQAPQEE